MLLLPDNIFWHKTKNLPLRESEVSKGSHKKVWWECSKDHEWENPINVQTKIAGCPICAGKRVLSGYNDLATTQPNISSQWSTKNAILPTEISAGSHKKVWWQCSKGHEWEAYVYARQAGKGCPYCSGKKAVVGVNDLATLKPELATQWHPTKNGLRQPISFLLNSNSKVWWLGDCGHEWEAVIANRASGTGCPVCAGQKPSSPAQTLEILEPNIAAQWHPTKNAILLTNLMVASGKKVWWQCSKGHEWEAYVYARTGKNKTGCPKCSNHTSKPELLISDFINSSIKTTLITHVRTVIPGELDIYIPEKKIAIEFNGLYWHSETAGKHKNYHYNKWLACKEKGIQLIQVWEDDWNRNPELIKRMLAHKIGFSQAKKISARNTQIVNLATDESSKFLEENHIQGYVAGGIRVGLIEKETNQLVAVMVFKTIGGTEKNNLNLLRFATSAIVQGGFSKLLKHVETQFKPQSIITFSDNTVSDGGLYRNNGFIVASKVPADYMYIVKNQRVHKFNYRLKRFEEDPELLWDKNLTEKELAQLNNISRIWDAGKVKWVKVL